MVSHLLDLYFTLSVEVLQHHVSLVLSLDALVYLVVCKFGPRLDKMRSQRHHKMETT